MTITDPVGTAEIADRLGVTAATVYSWRHRAGLPGKQDPMPEPAITVTGTPIWRWADIRRWAIWTGRLHYRKARTRTP